MNKIRKFDLNKTLPTDLKKINPLMSLVFSKVMSLTDCQDHAFKSKLAFEEAVTNAMRHGNLLDPKLKVVVIIAADVHKIVIDIHDQGKGFNIKSIPDPTVKSRSDKPCGRGIFLMRSFMDSVRYYDKGRGVRMTRIFQKGRNR